MEAKLFRKIVRNKVLGHKVVKFDVNAKTTIAYDFCNGVEMRKI